jgi:ubiquinone/menaquinone biosynthesis C-methylase UbiE
MNNRVPLPKEPIEDLDAVVQYDKGAKHYMMPEYKYFVWKILRKGIKKGRVLDIGTGSGLLAIELAKSKYGKYFDIYALDISQDMLDRAVANAKKAEVENRIKFVRGTAASLPFPDNYFDLVMSYASLHHWFDPGAVIKETERVTRKNGTIIIRDNKRVYQNIFWRCFIWFISLFMNKRHRDNWPKAIMASYTIPEIKKILSQSGSGKWRVGSDFIYFDMYLELTK